MKSFLFSLLCFSFVVIIPSRLISQTTCPTPTGLTTTNISATGATLSWIAPAGTLAYIIQYRPVTTPESAWINVTSTSPNSAFVLTNLTCGTNYQWHVAAYCGNGSTTISPYSATIDFTTAPCTISCLAPVNLNTTNTSTTAATLTWDAVSGAVAYVVQYRPVTTPESPWINVPATQVSSITLTNLVCGTHYQWHVQTYCGTAPGNISPYSAIVDFTTAACPVTCPAPAGLTTTNITQTGATLSWVGAASSFAYIVQYRPITTPESAWINITVTAGATTTLSNLVCGTHYQWHVAAYCNNNTSTPSPYSAIIDFTTAACTVTCPAPTGLNTTNITQTGATLTWLANPAGTLAYVVQYRPITNPESAWINVTTQTASVTLTNLTCGTNYQWHVQAYCGTSSTNLSPYSVTIDFTTAACTTTCPAPTAPATTNIGTTVATFSWTGVTGAPGYVIQYRPVTTPESVWITINTQNPNTTFTVANLTCGTLYQWHVAALCGNGTTAIGPYTTAINFTTAPCATACLAPTGLTTGNIGTTVATLTWVGAPGSLAYVVQYRPVTTPESAWINVPATQASIVTLTNLTCGTHYQWHVQAYCGSSATNLSPYSVTIDFTTAACPVTCPAPAGLTTTNITQTGATLTWLGAAGSFAYIVQYRPVTTPESPWTNITVTAGATTTLSNLVCGTHYQWHVAAYCNNNTSTPSPYSAIIDFTTAACTTACLAPTGLTTGNIGTTVATLSWVGALGSLAYVVQYRPVTTPESAWINVPATQSSTVTLTNLTCGTHYQWHVAGYCGTAAGSISPYSVTIDFTTAPCTTTCPGPAGLNTTNITATGATLSWLANPAGTLAYVVQYRPVTNPESAWINVPATQASSVTLTNLVCGTHYQWHVAAYCGTAPGSISPYSITIDFTTAPCTTTCPAPTGLNTTNITATGATLSWLANPAGTIAYVVQYRPVTNPESAWINVTTQTVSVTLTNLACGTHYQWHVAAYCGTATGNISPYSVTIDFTTAPCTTTCPAPTGLTTTNISTTGATLSWTGAAGSLAYIVQYRPILTPGAAWINVTTQSSSITLTNLVCGTHYQWHVRGYCGTTSGSISPYSITVDFTTLPCTTNVCLIPTGLSSTVITATPGSRLLSWNSTGALAYYIRYRVTGTPTWNTTLSTTNSKLITGLQSSSNYEWQVQSICSTNAGTVNTSDWSQLANFDTPFRAIFPNPATGRSVQVPVVTENQARVTVVITDQVGNTVRSIDKTVATGGEYVDIDIANLNTGVYFIQVRGVDTNINKIQKLFITR